MAALFYLTLQVFLPFFKKKKKRYISVWAFTVSSAEAYLNHSISVSRRSRMGQMRSPRTCPWYRLWDVVCMRVSHLLGFSDEQEHVLIVKTSVSSRSLKIGQGGESLCLTSKTKSTCFFHSLYQQTFKPLGISGNSVESSQREYELGVCKLEKQWIFYFGHCK